jgi:alpha-beta hydrolase superfamily lysophospholipase
MPQNTSSFSNTELLDKMKEFKRKTKIYGEEYLAASDGVRLAYYSFTKNRKRPGIIVFHGGGAHATAGYQFLAERLFSKNGYNVYLFDLRGHGKSEGKRGDTPYVNRVYQDIKEIIAHVRALTDGRVYVIGHSSASGMLLNYYSWLEKNSDMTSDASGYIFISPEFGYRSKTARKGRREFARVKRWIFVVAGMTGGRIGGNWYAVYFNYPPEVLASDPLLIDRITRNMSVAQTPDEPAKQFAGIRRPFAIFIGSNDELMDPEKVIAYAAYSSLPIRQKSTARILNGAGHLSAIWRSSDAVGALVDRWERENQK